MDISVIVPIYGVEKFIEQALISLFSQTKTSGVEFILVNDCSRDASINIARDVVRRFDTLNIKIIEHQKNKGVAAARQTGLDAASGVYTIHFDPDDWVEPEMLEELYAEAIKTNADIVGCDYIKEYADRKLYTAQYMPSDGCKCIDLLFSVGIDGVLWNKLIKRSLFIEHNINFEVGINLWEDLFICSKLFCHTDNIRYIPKAYLHYMQVGGSMVHSFNIKNIEAQIYILTSLEALFDRMSILDKLERAAAKREVMFKLGLLQNTPKLSRCTYANIFPEVNKTIMKSKNIQFKWRVALYCASHNMLWMFNLIDSFIRLRRTVYKRNKGIIISNK